VIKIGHTKKTRSSILPTTSCIFVFLILFKHGIYFRDLL
jgi:hypothetical protein